MSVGSGEGDSIWRTSRGSTINLKKNRPCELPGTEQVVASFSGTGVGLTSRRPANHWGGQNGMLRVLRAKL